MNRKLFHKSISNSLTINRHTGMENSPFTPLWAAVSPVGMRYLSFGISREEFLKRILLWEKHTDLKFSPHPDPAFDQVIAYLTGRHRMFSIPIDDHGWTDFQKTVYQDVLQIPYGQTKTYGEIAQRINKPQAARAVGAANGANPIPIIIPCHRLVGSDGSLRGYGGKGGISTKQWLLDLEIRTAKMTS
jgi:methylated-DNA-[protein]-cysteine S-methyltransferase